MALWGSIRPKGYNTKRNALCQEEQRRCCSSYCSLQAPLKQPGNRPTRSGGSKGIIAYCSKPSATIRAMARSSTGSAAVRHNSIFARSASGHGKGSAAWAFALAKPTSGSSTCSVTPPRASRLSAQHRPQCRFTAFRQPHGFLPSVSAMCALRLPIGSGRPSVVSFFVWCSISAFSVAPSSTMNAVM